MDDITRELDKMGCDYSRGFSMDRYTTMRVGGSTELVVYPGNAPQLVEVLTLLTEKGIDWTILGSGSNSIIGPDLKGAVVSTKRLKGIQIGEDGGIEVEAGASLGQTIKKCLKANLVGLEFAAGIPGTVGGALVMNAGANGGEMKDVTERVWVWHEGEEVALSPEEIGFQYRKSGFPEGSVITRALLRLSIGDGKAGEKRVKEYLKRRAATQPVESANSGCVFKNPPEMPAGKLLDELGLKGFRIGAASFSTLHANFIVNAGGARIEDVLELIKIAKERALEERGIVLETELKIIGARN